MTIHEDDTTQKPEISFSVETTASGAIGTSVFSDDETAHEELSLAETKIAAEEMEVQEVDDTDEDSPKVMTEADSEDEELSAHENSDEELIEVHAADQHEENSDDNLDDHSDEQIEAAEPGNLGMLSEELTLTGKIESIIFASPKPMRAVEIHELLMEQGYTLKEVQDACDDLLEFYRDRAGGFHLKYIKRMGYQFQTTPAAKPLMEKQFSSRPRPLSRASLETLAVIAYRQKKSKGVTRAEVEFIRGVDAGSIFKTLAERNLLTCIGRKEIPGRPMMFGVTDEFLKIFQLGSISDLPPLESFQTPQDVLEAANQKITDFEAEQEGVDTEKFIADEEYSEDVRGGAEFNPLAAEASIYAPTLEGVNQDAGGQLAAETSDADLPAASLLVDEQGESKADLIDVLNEGQVAWSAAEVHTDEREIQGASAGAVINSLDGIDDDEWGEVVPVETTANESPEVISNETLSDEPSEAQLNERDATTEVAFPVGDSQPPGGGEVDQ